jgi:hypothetical protein
MALLAHWGELNTAERSSLLGLLCEALEFGPVQGLDGKQVVGMLGSEQMPVVLVVRIFEVLSVLLTRAPSAELAELTWRAGSGTCRTRLGS